MMSVTVQRVYDAAQSPGGKRILVDRVWPRGIKKEALHLDLWLREIAPSTALRKWFGHDPKRWAEFQRRYRAELRRPEQQERLHQLEALARKGRITLLYGARDTEHNEAEALRRIIEASLKK